MSVDKNGWIFIQEGCELPPYDKRVLVYYEWYSTGKDKTKYEEIKMGFLDHCTEGSSGKRYEWRDEEHQTIEPTHWQPLPQKPKSSTTPN